MNIVAIDPSLISTAVCTNGKLFNYVKESLTITKKGDLSKWFKMFEDYITYKYVNYTQADTYSENELIKLRNYDEVTDLIISDILDNIDKSQKTIIGIESYSFSSNAGPLIDLVTFSTLLRKKLYDLVSNDIIILAPKTLKMESCKLTYKPTDIGIKKPKLEWRNYEGVSGGSFTKIEIYKSLIENESWINDDYIKYLKLVKDDILSNSKIQKPIEDINDAVMIYKYLQSKLS